MKGAIIGDIVGSIYEHQNIKTKDFPFFGPSAHFTDDTVMTCAIANAIMVAFAEDTDLYDEFIDQMQTFGRRYPGRGYGGNFQQWLYSNDPQPYESFGNGAPMRCSAAGFLCKSPEKARALAEETASPTHNHLESYKAAGLTAELIWRARHKASMKELREVAEKSYEIPSIDDLRQNYAFDISCQGTMPAVLACFFDSFGFEDAIRNAISIGGDSDTIAAITGSIAEAYYGINEGLWLQASMYLDQRLRDVVDSFYAFAENWH